MKKYLVIVLGILLSLAGFCQVPPEIENSETFGINKLPARTYIWPSPDLANAKASTYSVSFDTLTGMIAEYKINEQILIEGGISFNFWRTLTDNDLGWQVDQKMNSWENEGENAKLTGLFLSDLNDRPPVITGNYSFEETQSTAQLQSSIHSDGAIKVRIRMMIPDRTPNVPSIGLQYALSKLLRPDKFRTLNIDCAQMGFGGDNSWELPVNDPYLIEPKTYKYEFNI